MKLYGTFKPVFNLTSKAPAVTPGSDAPRAEDPPARPRASVACTHRREGWGRAHGGQHAEARSTHVVVTHAHARHEPAGEPPLRPPPHEPMHTQQQRGSGSRRQARRCCRRRAGRWPHVSAQPRPIRRRPGRHAQLRRYQNLNPDGTLDVFPRVRASHRLTYCTNGTVLFMMRHRLLHAFARRVCVCASSRGACVCARVSRRAWSSRA